MLRVVTLPPWLEARAALHFAEQAKGAGADALELRTDLHADTLPVAALADQLPLLVAERGKSLPEAWSQAARWVDRPLRCAADARTVLSHHAAEPLRPADAEALWRTTAHRHAFAIKHVEPLGEPGEAGRLFETQERLRALAGPDRVTVLATGTMALPFRAALAEHNTLDYVAQSRAWSAALGQRLLADAVRTGATGGATRRLGILGSDLALSRSPRIHPQPFDRIELPACASLGQFLDALRPLYRGLAVTSPFKRAAAQQVTTGLPAVNTLVARDGGWQGFNTDVEGARAALLALEATEVTVLGDGGVTESLRLAALDLGVRLEVVRRAEAPRKLRGAVVWTWPPGLSGPKRLSLDGARVAIVSYGQAARDIEREVVKRGGRPLRLGPRWFVAQARAQRALWEA